MEVIATDIQDPGRLHLGHLSGIGINPRYGSLSDYPRESCRAAAVVPDLNGGDEFEAY